MSAAPKKRGRPAKLAALPIRIYSARISLCTSMQRNSVRDVMRRVRNAQFRVGYDTKMDKRAANLDAWLRHCSQGDVPLRLELATRFDGTFTDAFDDTLGDAAKIKDALDDVSTSDVIVACDVYYGSWGS